MHNRRRLAIVAETGMYADQKSTLSGHLVLTSCSSGKSLLLLLLLGVGLATLQVPCVMGQQKATSNMVGIPLAKSRAPRKHIEALMHHALAPSAPAKTPVAAIDALHCNTIPTSATSTFDNYYYLSTDVAAQLGVTWIGTVNVSGGNQQIVLIREFRKYATCPTSDGSGTLEYGATLRATVEVSAASLKAGANFAVVAANATLNESQAQVYVENIGFNDSAIDQDIEKAMSDVSGGLTVQTFGDFSKDLQAALTAASGDSSKITSPFQKLAYIANTPSSTLSNSVASIFGLSCMAGGWGCLDAQNQFPGRNANSDTQIHQVYTTLTNTCGGVNDLQKATAQSLLSGLTTVPTCHN